MIGFHWRCRSAFARAFRGPRLVSLGGATEATVWSNYHPVAKLDPAWKSIPYGRPIVNARYYVLDEGLVPCPIGVPGGLHIGGECLASGYAQAAVQTGGSFLPDPYSGRCGAVMYRTGDRARFWSDGTIEFLGRLDRQVKVRGFRIELGEVEAALNRHPAVEDAVVVVRDDAERGKRLVAFVVGSTEPAVDTEELRRHLGARLPDYMVPAAFVSLEALPVTPNGKLDRAALERRELTAGGGGETDFVAPATATEKALARIWSDVLKIDPVGVQDNFFELGGDSILSIQLIARAGEMGLAITTRQLFQYPTIAELAMVAETVEAPLAEAAPTTGPVPLTAIQHWFFEQDLPYPDHFNQAVLLELATGDDGRRLEGSILRQAVGHLMRYHDALRLRFEPPGPVEPRWLQLLAEAAEQVPFQDIDLRAVPVQRQRPVLEELASGLQRSLSLSAGPIVRVARFVLGGGEADRLLVIVHHLAVDGVSWRILLQDLETACRQLVRGGVAAPPPRTVPFQAWARRIVDYASSEAVTSRESFWSRQLRQAQKALPLDHPGGANRVDLARTVEVSLEAEETRALLQEVPRAYRTRIDEVLVTALVKAFERFTGNSCLLFDLESHGREPIFEHGELSRTVGWFTALFPVWIDLTGVTGAGAALKSVKEQLRSIPDHGISYGLMRYLGGERLRQSLGSLPRCEVVFNYLGQLDRALPASGLLRPAHESPGAGRHAAQQRAYLLEIDGQVADGRLRMAWRYSRDQFQRPTIERLAKNFAEQMRWLIAHCLSSEAGGYTPSDFPLARLDGPTLERLLAASGEAIEDVFPLSPVQQGMAFHSLSFPESGVYVEQLDFTLTQALDLALFDDAWDRLLERHAILRISVFWPDGEVPLQVVHSKVDLPRQVLDWRGLSRSEQKTKVAIFLRDDRRRGFDLRSAPLMRLSLMRLGEESYRLIWSFHHMLLDGWSVASLLGELAASYESALAGQKAQPEPRRPYRDYVAWLEDQDPEAGRAFWRETLAGFISPTPLGVEHLETDHLEADAGFEDLHFESRRVELPAASRGGSPNLGPATPSDPPHVAAGGLGIAAEPLYRGIRRRVRHRHLRPLRSARRDRQDRRVVHQHPSRAPGGPRRRQAHRLVAGAPDDPGSFAALRARTSGPDSRLERGFAASAALLQHPGLRELPGGRIGPRAGRRGARSRGGGVPRADQLSPEPRGVTRNGTRPEMQLFSPALRPRHRHPDVGPSEKPIGRYEHRRATGPGRAADALGERATPAAGRMERHREALPPGADGPPALRPQRRRAAGRPGGGERPGKSDLWRTGDPSQPPRPPPEGLRRRPGGSGGDVYGDAPSSGWWASSPS